jgi:hypothetical protein
MVGYGAFWAILLKTQHLHTSNPNSIVEKVKT